MKILRYILFIPTLLISFGIIYFLFALLMLWFINLSSFWLIFILFFASSIIWGLFQGITSFIINLTSKISPNKMFSFWSALIISIIYGIGTIYNSWSMDVKYSGKIIFFLIIYSTLVVQPTIAIIIGAASAVEEEYEYKNNN